MSFNSCIFGVFLLIVFSIYWLALSRSYKAQNVWLLAAGYVFYGWWDWRFLGLIAATTVLSWACALPSTHRRLWCTVSVVANLLILCSFKYLGFFGDGLRRFAAEFGWVLDWFTVDVLLPVGISFYTFQAISYSVDAYKNRIEPTRDLLSYAVYIGFFPQLVAGPIERSTQLLPQFQRPRTWDYGEAVLGMRQILWGLFKKCVIADGIAFWVANGFDVHYAGGSFYSGVQCLLAAVGFSLQIYGDFSGYSDIARGTARLFGIRLMNNFLYPFFSRNAVELWHRWHRSLMQWFTEYVYIPLGGSRNGRRGVNVMIVFLLSGLWHGASMNFILWGVICGVWYLLAVVCGARKYRPGRDEPASRTDLPKIAFTFVLFIIAFVAFRAPSISHAAMMYRSILVPAVPTFAAFVGLAWLIKSVKVRLSTLIWIIVAAFAVCLAIKPGFTVKYAFGLSPFIFAALMLAAEWRSRRLSFALEVMPKKAWARMVIYWLLFLVTFSFAIDPGTGDFIYFQF